MEQRRRPAGLHLQAPHRHRLRPFFVYDRASGRTVNICKPMEGRVRFNAMVHRNTPFPGYDKYPVWSPDDRYIAFRSMATPGYEADKERLMRYDCRTAEITDLTPSFDYHEIGRAHV